MRDRTKAILRALQAGLPIEREPFRALACQLSMAEEELLDEVVVLKEEGIIRQISPVFDTRMLGYDSTLAAFMVAPRRLEAVAGVVSGHPGVSHNYERDGEFNLWFTLAVPPESRLGIGGTVALLAGQEGVEGHAVLGARTAFKVRMELDFGAGLKDKGKELERAGIRKPRPRPLTGEEKEVVRATQQDMPLTKRPFLSCADSVGVSEDRLVSTLRGLRDQGFMRRFAAVLHHRRAGYRANGMVVWRAPGGRVEEVGPMMASYTAVSHCYERATAERWPYNLYTMVHGRSEREVEELVGRMSEESGIKDFKIIYSRREFKKVRLRYFTEEFFLWEMSAIIHDNTCALPASTLRAAHRE